MVIKRTNKSVKKNQNGFTVIELMIATSIFGFILLVASVAIISIGRIYHKAIISTKAQEVSRRIVEDISGSLQFSDSTFSEGVDSSNPNIKSYCFGQDRYTYELNNKLPDGDVGLSHDIRTDQSNCEPRPSSGEQYLSNNMRLLKFDISSANPHVISVMVAYGDDDLLTIYDDSGVRNFEPLDSASCRPNIFGGTFCSVSKLETVVTNRVE